MTRRAVVLFARTPEAEAAAKGLTRKAVALFTSVTAAWLRAAARASATPVIACDAHSRNRFSTIAPEVDRLYIDQNDGCFGERLASVAARAAEIGFGPIVITGIDAPPPRDLARAFDLLESRSVDGAIAPARDGGVNIVAFRLAPLELLRTFTLRDGTIAARCRSYFGRVHLFRAASDIDSIADIAIAKRELSWSGYEALLGACLSVALHRDNSRLQPQRVSRSLPARAPPAA